MNVVLAGEQGFSQASLPIFLVISVSYGLCGTRACGFKPIEDLVTGIGRNLYHSDGQPLFNAQVLACGMLCAVGRNYEFRALIPCNLNHVIQEMGSCVIPFVL